MTGPESPKDGKTVCPPANLLDVPALHERILRSTAELHRQQREAPLFEAMDRGTLPRSGYASWLRTMIVVVGVLEHHLDTAKHPALVELWRPSMRTLPRLRDNAVAFDDAKTVGTQALAPLLELVATIRGWARHDEVALLGGLYALEAQSIHFGSRHETATSQSHLGGAGAGDRSGHAGPSSPRWKTFCRRLDGLDLTELAAASVVQAAADVLAKLGEIVTRLHPAQDDEHTVVNLLNYDAGTHSVTTDPREVLTAIDAGARTWSQYPYYEARYAQKGRRFTRSDSAWLVTLAQSDPEHAIARIQWLVRLLSTRGMPSLLFEQHLFHLHEALTHAIPERASHYRSIAELGRHLRNKRLSALPKFNALVTNFPYERPLANVGPILVGAVADERLGLHACVPCVQSWLTDPTRYPASWISAVNRSIAEARSS